MNFFGRLMMYGLRFQRTANRIDAQPCFFSDLAWDAFFVLRAFTPPVRQFGDRCSILRHLSRLQQFRIAANMLVALFLGQIVAMQVLSYLPKLSG
ncbi:hypothetical protein YP76_07110 [Sphingobium chungbukense]|uniref:Uncharacterized protein n=1 Tax=Sphingobium chungbukense TaxID=56193 RepID=A0A0M3AVX2_9SPHN|nr:hypothetical protein YP76_07110 [Sphingobium chungbukense]